MISIPEPPPDHAVGEAEVTTKIYVFPQDSTAVSSWEDDTRCALYLDNDGRTIHIMANVAGLRSLARHCLTLAQDGQEGGHIDYDADTGWFDTPDLGLRISRAWD